MIELQQLESLKKHGYKENHGILRLNRIFIKGEEFLYSTSGGLHRVGVMSALGFKEIPLRVSNKFTKVTNRNDVESWYHVQSGLYTKKQALQIFDRGFKTMLQE